MSRAVLSIGSNLGDRLAYLRLVVVALGPRLVAASPVYQTPPFGTSEPQGAYLNAVLVAEDGLDPAGWLAFARGCETAAERVRAVRWGPRTLDVDVVAVDDERSNDPELTLPHPRAAERAFVLVPWLAADPVAVLPGAGTVSALVHGLPQSDLRDVRRCDDDLVAP